MSENIMFYTRIIGFALVPVVISVALLLAEKFTRYGGLSYRLRQLITGILFGAGAFLSVILGTEVYGAPVDVCDAAPLCAGLFFGSPAGILAGVIGGAARFFRYCSTADANAVIAYTASVAAAGLIAACLRKFIFDDKRPTPIFGLSSAGIMEIVSAVILSVMHLGDPDRVLEVIKATLLPLVVSNAFAVWLSALLMAILLAGFKKEKSYRRISQQVQTPLLIAVVLAFFATSVFVYALQTSSAKTNANKLININITDIVGDITDDACETVLRSSRNIISAYSAAPETPLAELAEAGGAIQLRITDKDGRVTAATDRNIGFRLSRPYVSGEFRSRGETFSELLGGGCDEFLRAELGGNGYIAAGGKNTVNDELRFIEVIFPLSVISDRAEDQVRAIVANRHIGESGYFLVAGIDGVISSNNVNINGKMLSEVGISDIADTAGEVLEGKVNGEDAVYGIKVNTTGQNEGYIIVAVIPSVEVYVGRDNVAYVNACMEILVFAALFIVVYIIIKRIVVNKIRNINSSLSRIIGGDLDTVVSVRSSDEFASLSDDINSTVATLKKYIEEAAGRIDRELAFAHHIQSCMLPSVFPAFPDRGDFGIFASMNTAREVGGDFYDFYLINENTLGFLIADVSGKGIPAAMFMMTAKTMIKDFAQAGLSCAEIFTRTNIRLCSSNEADMFVTAWMGILNLSDGTLSFVNAGHNPPVIIRDGEAASFLKTRPDLVLACMDDTVYHENTIRLEPGDRIFLYTDGVTEAANTEDEFYGEKRLLSLVDSVFAQSAENAVNGVLDDVRSFAGGAEQTDDITMLAFKYNGGYRYSEKSFRAEAGELDGVLDFVSENVERVCTCNKTLMHISLSVEEAFINIVNYAYGDAAGDALVGVGTSDDFITVSISDTGIPFDPLTASAADTAPSPDDEKIGGLGIFMIKKQMDSVEYKYENGRNVLIMKKKIKNS